MGFIALYLEIGSFLCVQPSEIWFVAGDFHNRTLSGTVQVLTPSNQATPQLSDPSQSDKVNYAVSDSEAGDAAIGTTEEEKDIDPLNKFLPPPPKAKCSEELQVSSSNRFYIICSYVSFISSRHFFIPCLCFFLLASSGAML